MQRAVDRSFNETEEMNAPVKDRFHVGTEVAPGKPEQHDERDDSEEEAHLELLRLEHCVAKKTEHRDRQNQKNDL